MKKNLLDLRAGAFISSDTRLAWVWLIARVYVGWIWLEAGLEKFSNPAWNGENAGTAITGFLNGALKLASGDHPAVLSWYATLIRQIALPNAELLSYIVTYGEIVIGVSLILGFLTAKAAGFGALMNLNFMLAGSAGLNPVMFIIQILLIVAWRTSGWLGLDRWVLPRLISMDKKKRFFV